MAYDRYKDPDARREYMRKYYQKQKQDATFVEERRVQNAKYYRARKIALLELHGQKSCQICGESRIYCLDFHHRDPSMKKFGIGNTVGPIDQLVDELAKCDVLCKNCHAEIHYGEHEDG